MVQSMNKSQSSSLIYEEMDGFEKNGSKCPFEVIWIDPKRGWEFSLFWPNLNISHFIYAVTSFKISCLETLPLIRSSLRMI